MANQRRWERDELLVAFYLYSHTPFGRISQRNPEIIQIAELMQRSASSLSMKMANIASCDPSITSTGRKGLPGASRADKAMWQEMTQDWETFYLKAYAAHQQLMQSSEPQNVKSVGTDDFHGRERETLTKEGANKSHVCSASAYRPGCKAWFAANGPSPLQEAQHSRQVCKPRPSGLSQQPALCVIRLRQAPACLQSDALNANGCASQSATRTYSHLP